MTFMEMCVNCLNSPCNMVVLNKCQLSSFFFNTQLPHLKLVSFKLTKLIYKSLSLSQSPLTGSGSIKT